jgi:hypothetical protein
VVAVWWGSRPSESTSKKVCGPLPILNSPYVSYASTGTNDDLGLTGHC